MALEASPSWAVPEGVRPGTLAMSVVLCDVPMCRAFVSFLVGCAPVDSGSRIFFLVIVKFHKLSQISHQILHLRYFEYGKWIMDYEIPHLGPTLIHTQEISGKT